MLKLIIQGGLALILLLAIAGIAIIAPLNQQVGKLVERVAELERRAPHPALDLDPLKQQLAALSEILTRRGRIVVRDKGDRKAREARPRTGS